MTVPIAMSPGRGGFTPQLALSYDSGTGNSAFGLGWNIGLPGISRKTQTGLPQYDGLPRYEDTFESDVFLLSGAEDLVPLLDQNGKRYEKTEGNYKVYRYRPRIEGIFARIEKWVDATTRETHWKSVTKENITTIYGQSAHARIVDPADPRKVFQWLIEKTWDDKGNIIEYQYKKEDGAGLGTKPIFEKNRNSYAQTYLKRVLYGNTIPFQHADFSAKNKWLFELVLDYGEHFQAGDLVPVFDEKHSWPLRPDIFSSFRSGFDIRTYRLCRRMLMFHHFEAELGVKNYLVKATQFEFDENPIATQLKSVIHTGYRIDDQGKYVSKSFPPVTFKYSQQKIDERIYTIHSEDLPNVPQGIDGRQYQFNDLYGEGLNGILQQTGTAWYYKRNLGDGRFGPMEMVGTVPSLAANASVQIADFGGDGLTDMLVQTGDLNGYFELSEEAEWSHFKPFAHPVNFNLNDPALRLIDLDGNGIPDILITEDDCFVWYPADARDGYKAARCVAKALEEESGPCIVFNEAFQTIFLADMSGSGLTDIVRIRNGEICYWANLGYGRFSAKIAMQGAPRFDLPDYYDPARLRLADIDGAGVTDILYLGRDKISYWLNQSGNGWGPEMTIEHFPRTSNLHTVSVFDLLGNGTACIVWSSPLPAEANTPMKYIKLMGDTVVEGNKPYLLNKVDNNMGAITRLKYEASTKFYLEDRLHGQPWITKLPFPVQVLVRQEVYDEIAGNHFVSRYAYHHGYFDRMEREFRGFGMVEQWDTEDYETLSKNSLLKAKGQNWSEQTDMPPVHTKTWFHNGYYREGGKITKQYESEYYRDDPDRWLLPDTALPTGLSAEERREAARAIKGRPLRVEIYAKDGSAAGDHPYSVAETKYHVRTIQNRHDNRHASFYVCECETLSYHYERNPADPRIAHQSTLEIDDFGNVLKAAAIVYPRREAPPNSPQGVVHHPEQKRGYVTLAEADFINKPDETDWYRIGVPYAQRSYEITGLTLNKPYEKEALQLALAAASEIPFEQQPTTGIQKRLLAGAKSSFYKEDLSGELLFGEIAPHGLPYHAYEAVYTAGLIAQFEKDGQPLLGITEIENEAGFLPMDGLWWRVSGKAIFDAQHFYLPVRQLDPFGHAYDMGYDVHHLAMTETSTQVYGKTVKTAALLDYRTLQPTRMTDPNGNQSEAIFDEMGMVIATAVMGKNGEGDTLAGYTYAPYPDQDMRAAMYANPHAYLQGATGFFFYDLHAWRRDGKPNYALGIARETHAADENGTPTKTQISFSYSDGFGQAIMVKVQAEPGDAFRLVNGAVLNDPADPRWVGNGRTVFNNKGKPVKQYEPYFSHNYGYEKEKELVEYGVTPVLHYDPLGRNIRTDLPDGTYTKVEFTPWEQSTWDQNDTSLDSQWYADRGSPDPAGPEPNGSNYDNRAAFWAALHANTPKTEFLDTLGRVFLLRDYNRNFTPVDVNVIPHTYTSADEYVDTRFRLDILGNPVEVTDAKGRLITRNGFNMAKEPIHTHSMDAGRRWSMGNILGNPLYQWNDRNFRSRTEYDELQRPVATWLSDNGAAEEQVFKTEYGEQHPNPAVLNLFGQLWRLYDQSGRRSSEAFDFKGNPLRASQQVAVEYKKRLDWAKNPALEAEIFQTEIEYDALNRPVKTTAPDKSETRYTYNEANFLEKLQTRLRGGNTFTDFVKNIDYDAKGQRTSIQYGNGVTTTYAYDPQTFRLTRLRSTRASDSAVLQDLNYYYDPVGNITDLRDDAQQTIFYKNAIVAPHGSYTYDALYRLTEARGREHIGQNSAPANPLFYQPVIHPSDGSAMRNYCQKYEYDELGNLLFVRHRTPSCLSPDSWVRAYEYQHEFDPVHYPGIFSNRLTKTILGGLDSKYTHDIHGNMTAMPHLPAMDWDFADQLAAVDLGGGGREYYTYAMGIKDFGVRARKVTEKPGGKICDRIYLGDYEVYRERNANGAIELERATLHIQDDKGRIALIDTRTIENSSLITHHSSLTRFQLSNHLGSAAIELDEKADLITYEEYYPFGASSYRTGRTTAEVSLKRYRYVGKERDESTGLDYYGARYYAFWVCRFVSIDPLILSFPFETPFEISGNNPIFYKDLGGKFKYPAEKEAEYRERFRMLTQYLEKNIEHDVAGSKKIIEGFQYSNPNIKKETIQSISKWGNGPTIYFDELVGEFPQEYADAAGWADPDADMMELNIKYADYVEGLLRDPSYSEEDKLIALSRFQQTLLHETAHLFEDYGVPLKGTGDKWIYRKLLEKPFDEAGYKFEQYVWGYSDYQPLTWYNTEDFIESNEVKIGVLGIKAYTYYKGVEEGIINEAKKTEEGKKTLPTIPK